LEIIDGVVFLGSGLHSCAFDQKRNYASLTPLITASLTPQIKV